MEENIVSGLKNFIKRYIPNYELQEDENMFTLGFINSLFVMQLLLFIKKQFGIQVEKEELAVENFQSIAALTAYIKSKLSSRLQEEKP